jgi:predicted transposase YbfD/YdcC
VEQRSVHAFAIEPLTADFPFARSLIVVRSARTIKKTGQTSTESRYYLASQPPTEHPPERWLALIRGHWGGVEVRNHWRRDALLGEDRSRSRNASLLANVALIRSALLALLAQHHPDQPLPQIQEQLHSRPNRCLALLNS